MQNVKPEAQRDEKRASNSGARHAAPKTKKKRFPKALITAAVIIVAAFALLTVYANNYTSVFPNTYVSGQLVSNMTDSELAEFITTTYSADKLENATLTLVCKDKTTKLGMAELNIDFNHAAYAEKVMRSGKDGNPLLRGVDFVSRFFDRVDVTPVISYNTEVLAKAFDEATADYEIDPVGYTFNIEKDSVTIHASIDGVKADRNKATADFESQVTAMKIGTITLDPVPVSPEPLDFDEFYKWLTSDAQDAYYEKIDGKVIVHPSKAKCEVDSSVVKQALDNLKTSGEGKITIPVKTTEPQNTTETFTELLYKDKLGTYSTNFGSSSYARANNVRLATGRINGIELMPGEELSYDKTILPRTSANGYMPAGVYVGNKSDVGMGGGICQPSSTLYAAALYANLEIAERHNHSLPVSYLPSGMDATIAEGYLDLRIRNNTNYPVKIVSSAEGGVCTFSIYGYNEKNVSVDIERSFSGGAYHVTRVVKENGTEVKREKMSSSVYGTPEKDEDEKKQNNSQTQEASQSPQAAESTAAESPAAANNSANSGSHTQASDATSSSAGSASSSASTSGSASSSVSSAPSAPAASSSSTGSASTGSTAPTITE